jgi:DNA-binding FadR family transcriptional regulator
MVDGLDVASHLRLATTMTNGELVSRYNSVKEELKARGEIVEPRTDEGRDLHSEHTALLNELHERNLR